MRLLSFYQHCHRCHWHNVILCCSIILAKQIATFVTTILIFINQADDTLLTEQRNLLDLINKLEGGLGQVETQIFSSDSLQSYPLELPELEKPLVRKMRVQQECYR